MADWTYEFTHIPFRNTSKMKKEILKEEIKSQKNRLYLEDRV